MGIRSPIKAHVRWVKQWVPQDIVATGGRCLLLKWVREDALQALKEKTIVPEQEKEPEPTTETLFLCSYEGCGKTFFDVPSLKKHSHQVHHERQYVCQYEGCGKKFVDSSKLKRHNLTHTGERDHVCPYEGCGKSFSLDFNLRAHMKTHLPENYHICPHLGCGKRFTHDHKLQAHMKSHHEKNGHPNFSTKRISPPDNKLQNTASSPAAIETSPFTDRPFVCQYEGCNKAYIHEYKLNLHLKREHPQHNGDGNGGMEYDGKKTFPCPHEGCSKSYIYEYKLNLHLKREHPMGFVPERSATNTTANEPEATESGRRSSLHQKNYTCPFEGCHKSYLHEYKLKLHLQRNPHHSMANGKHSRVGNHEENDNEYDYVGNNAVEQTPKRFKPDFPTEAHSSQMVPGAPNPGLLMQQWSLNPMQEDPMQEDGSEEDSEKTNEDRDNDENGWESDEEENVDDEETEDDGD